MKKRSVNEIALSIAKARVDNVKTVALNRSNRPPASAYEALTHELSYAVAAGIRADRRQRSKP